MMMKFAACLAVLACVAPGAYAGDSSHSMGDFSLGGYVDGEFLAQQANAGGVPGADTEWKSSFGNNSHVVIWANSDPSQKASFTSHIWYWQATNAFTVAQAAIDYRLYSTDAYGVTARMGKFYYPFGIESRTIYATDNRLVSRPNLQAWSDNGVEVMGGGKLGESGVSMNWAFAVTNGQTGAALAPQTTDVDKNKSVGGTVSVMPMEPYEIGGSFQFGKWDAAGDNNYLLVGAHAVAKPMPGLEILGEWAMSQADKAGSLANPDLKSMALYGQAGYGMPLEGDTSVGFTARFGWTDPDTDTDNDDYSQVAVGANYSPAKMVNFKLEFDLNMENVTGTEPDNNAVLAQAVVGW